MGSKKAWPGHMRPLICTTIFAKDKPDFLGSAKRASAMGSDLAELRIDHLEDATPSLLGQIVSESPLPLIATNRSERDGGLALESEESARLSLLESILEYEPDFVDIEYEIPEARQSKLFDSARNNSVR
ncbi:MAG: type I 3-dehydroquinate dehydratase, partial [Nitrososphaerales archaeon]